MAYHVAMSKRPLGRPRDDRVDEALAPAVRQLLAEIGYTKTTIDAIASRAGVGRPAIYRRYRSKAELIFAVTVRDLAELSVADTGDLRGDLGALFCRIHRELVWPGAASVLSGLLADMLVEPKLAERFRRTFIQAQRDVVAEICARAVDRGELKQSPDPILTHALILGPLFVQLVVLGESISNKQLAAHTEVVVRGLGAA